MTALLKLFLLNDRWFYVLSDMKKCDLLEALLQQTLKFRKRFFLNGTYLNALIKRQTR